MEKLFEVLDSLRSAKNMQDVDTLIKYYTNELINNRVCPNCGGDLIEEVINPPHDYQVVDFLVCEDCDCKFPIGGE